MSVDAGSSPSVPRRFVSEGGGGDPILDLIHIVLLQVGCHEVWRARRR